MCFNDSVFGADVGERTLFSCELHLTVVSGGTSQSSRMCEVATFLVNVKRRLSACLLQRMHV